MNRKATLTTGPVERHLFNLAMPALIGLLCTFSFVLADTYFISLLGRLDITAFSFIMPIVDFIIGAAIGVGISISSIVARKIGANEHEGIKNYVTHSVIICFLIGAVLTIIGLNAIHPLFTLLGAKPATIHLVGHFMRVWYWGIFLIFFVFIGSNALRASGLPKWPAIVQVLMAVINIVLDPVLIFYCHMGIQGAAVAGLIARTIGVSILFYTLWKQDLLAIKDWDKRFSAMLTSWKQMIAITIPASLTNVIGPISTFWITYLLARIASTAVAGFGIASKIQLIFLIPLFVLSGSIGPVVGQNYAAKQAERSYEALKKCSLFAIFWGILLAFILLILAKPIALIFSHNPDIIKVSIEYLWIVPVSFTAWGVLMMANANFNALGYPKRSTLLSFARLIVCFMPLSLLLNHWLGYRGIFIAFSCSTFLLAIIGFFWARAFYIRCQM